MAKPLFERIQAALGPHARAPDVEALIGTIAKEIVSAERDIAAQHTIATAASSDDATAEAAADAEVKAQRRLVRLRGQHADLTTRHTEILNSERRKVEQERWAATLAERDQLVIDLQERWPVLAEEMTSLLQRIVDMDKRTGTEPSAEALARGCPPNFYCDGGPMVRLTDASIPRLAPKPSLDQLAWPKHVSMNAHLNPAIWSRAGMVRNG